MTGPTPHDTRHFGEQIVWIEEPDVFVMRLSGEIDGPSLQALLAFQDSWAAGNAHSFVLCDLSQATGATIEARRVLQGQRPTTARMTHACFGARFSARVLADLVVRAARLLGTVPPETEIMFFANESEARAYIDHTRRAERRRQP